MLVFFAPGTFTARQQATQKAPAESSMGDVESLVAQGGALGFQNATPELRAALIARLEQLNRQVSDATRLDRTVDTFIAPETLAQLSEVVAELCDPRAIPALSRATYGGRAAVRALAEFGEQALPALTGVVMAPSSHYTEIEHGLLTMRIMVERGKLSPGALGQIRAAAKARLTGLQYFTVVWTAIDLAAALKAPELISILSDLATHPSESHRLGITNLEADDLVEKTQKRAADRLAGVPALPSAEMVFAPPASLHLGGAASCR
jgi:hypothetical protein